MNTNTVWWVGWGAAATIVVSWGMAAGEPWRAVEQPELRQSLEQAPLLQTESLGEPARGVQPWEHWAVPNPDGKSWDVLQWYLEYGWGQQELFVIDLGTGQVKQGHPIPTINSVYLSGRALGFDGKYYIVTHTRGGGGLHMFIYDPGTNSVEDGGLIMPQLSGELSPIVVGPDGRIYGSGPGDGGKVGLYIYDATLQKVVKDFGLIGPKHTIGSTIASSIGVDDTHAYIVSGCAPAYLLAVNLATGEKKVLFETPDVLAPSNYRMEVIESFPGAWATVPEFDSMSYKQYWLYHGQAIPKVDDNPPWPKQPSPWDKAAATKPELYYDQAEPDEQGNATLWYRLPEDAAKAPKEPPADAKPEDLGWRSVALKGVELYSGRIGPLALLPDGLLYGAAEYYMGSFLFDPKTDKTTPLGRKQGLCAYTRLVYRDKCYSSGYPGNGETGRLLETVERLCRVLDYAGAWRETNRDFNQASAG